MTLKKNLKKDVAGLKSIKLAIFGDSATQYTIGRETFWSPSVYTNTEMVASIDALPYLHSLWCKLWRLFRAFLRNV